MIKQIVSIIILSVIFNTLFGQQVNTSNLGTFNDPRDHRVYKTVKIGTQTWMAENLAYKTDNGSWSYNNDISNVEKYGYLYDWETSLNVCPTGWHLPSDDEWKVLLDYLINSSEDLNSSGFSSLPGGLYLGNGKFTGIKTEASLWSATEENQYSVKTRVIGNGGNSAGIIIADKRGGHSIRCLKNNNYDEKVNSEKVTDEKVPDEILDVADQMPQFPGGDESLMKFIDENIKYPNTPKEKKTEGKVIVRFCITKEGNIGKINILKGVNPYLNLEAIRVIKTLPRFKPGMNKGVPVNVWYMVPINFTINDNNVNGDNLNQGKVIRNEQVQSNRSNNLTSKDIWIKKSVTKFQMYNPRTDSWEEIMFTNPGKYIEIRNDKDFRVQDDDILNMLIQSPDAVLYTTGQFIDGVRESTNVEMSTRYRGNFVLLDENGIPSKQDITVIDFFYDRNNNLGGLEFQSYLCKCKAQIFFTDYEEGLQIVR